MALPAWWQVATPHKDIREGKLSEAIFAADLGDAVSGKAPLEYKDPCLFFEKTYLTQGLKNLLENVAATLQGQRGDPFIQLQTPFGGGKTHALLALYHFVNNREKIDHISGVGELPKIENAKVAVFVGTHADAVAGRTPWGEIAAQLGQYEVVKEHDRKRVAPGKGLIRKILENAGPTLILIDEILEYIVKANRAEKAEKIMHGQTLAFLQELTEVVGSSENCCLVITLPASILERYDEEAEKALQQLQKISGRIEAIYTPVEGSEIYEVIRKRLFESLGEEKDRKKVAQAYFDLYQRLATDVPSEVKEVEYRERIEKAYPFHPELIDTLYDRWGSFPTFQRTRGVLRLLAEVVADLYKRKVVSPLIQSSLVNLGNQIIRREFIKHIGNEYESVISADIAGKNSKAAKIDKEMGSEYEKYEIAKGIATTVFLNSFSAGTSKETSLPRIRVGLLREGIPATIVGDAISKLEDELWYFHSEKKQYAFRNQPNLNRVIVDREETISSERIRDEMKDTIEKCAGKALEVYLWPESSSDIPDNKQLKLALLSPAYTHGSDEQRRIAEDIYDKAGLGYRAYRNTLFMLAIEENQQILLEKAMRRVLALRDIQGDKFVLESLTLQSQEELKKKLKEAEKELPFKILSAYRHLSILEESGIAWKDMGIPTIGSHETISERVLQYLIDQEKVLSHLTPKYILDRTFSRDEKEKTLREIYELHLKTPGMALPKNEEVLKETIREGVKNGLLGVREGETIFFRQLVEPNMDSLILRGDVAETLIKKQERVVEEEVGKEYQTEGHKLEEVEEGGFKEEPKKGEIRLVRLKALIPWDKVSNIVSGVIGPLKERGSISKIVIEVEAKSEKGFDRMTLDNKVKETLQQIGATIEGWEENSQFQCENGN